jgi:hypothetical protein
MPDDRFADQLPAICKRERATKVTLIVVTDAAGKQTAIELYRASFQLAGKEPVYDLPAAPALNGVPSPSPSMALQLASPGLGAAETSAIVDKVVSDVSV